MFSCQSNSAVEWLFNGNELPQNVKISKDTKKIRVDNVNWENIGNYECRGKITDFESDFYSISTLSIAGKI